MEYNLDLFAKQDPVVVADVDCDSAVDKTWCRPSCHSDIVGLDFGKQGMVAYFANTGRVEVVQLNKEIEWLLSLPPLVLLICEWAHLAVPQTDKSLAQFFTETELLSLYKSLKASEVTLRLFPHYHSSRARLWAASRFPEIVCADKSDDSNDAKALALYVKYCNGISLSSPPVSFSRCGNREYGLAVIRQSNRVLNAERVRGYAGTKFPRVVELGEAIHRRCKAKFIDRMRAISIASLIVTEIDGEPYYFTRKGVAPGSRFWLRYVMRFTPFHHRGGIARSNLMMHGFPSFFVSHAARAGVCVKDGKKKQKFGSFSVQQERARQACMKTVRESVLRAYRIGVEQSASDGFKAYEILEHDQRNIQD